MFVDFYLATPVVTWPQPLIAQLGETAAGN